MRSANSWSLGRVGELSFSAEPSALIGSVLLWVLISVAAGVMLTLPIGSALLVGLAAVALHWLAVLLHQMGHVLAARGTGYPVVGIRLWWVLSASVYPNEPELPREVHARRALGGPVASLILGILFAALLAVIPPGSIAWLVLIFCLDNLFVLCVGALLPLGFTDGSTLLRLYGRRGGAG